MVKAQDKQKEIAFFNRHAAADEYDVFSERSSRRIIDRCLAAAQLEGSGRIADLGCGSGVFSSILEQKGFDVCGVDLAHGLTVRARHRYPNISFITADLEHLPFAGGSLDAILFSGVVHHLPDPMSCAMEAFRVLKPGGVFMAFDPNRMNPFMYLYRDRSSWFYSSDGVTENERPVLAKEIERTFSAVGFKVSVDYLSGLSYRYVASPLTRMLLPVYNLLDFAFLLPPLKPFASFVVATGIKLAD